MYLSPLYISPIPSFPLPSYLSALLSLSPFPSLSHPGMWKHLAVWWRSSALLLAKATSKWLLFITQGSTSERGYAASHHHTHVHTLTHTHITLTHSLTYSHSHSHSHSHTHTQDGVLGQLKWGSKDASPHPFPVEDADWATSDKPVLLTSDCCVRVYDIKLQHCQTLISTQSFAGDVMMM